LDIGLKTFAGSFLGFSLLILFGLAIAYCKNRCCGHALLIFNCFFVMLFILAFAILSPIMLFTAYGGYGFCEAFKPVLTDQTIFLDFANQTKFGLDQLTTCFFGDGKILNQSNISAKLNSLDDLLGNVNKMQEIAAKPADYNLESSISTISYWISVVSQLYEGKRNSINADFRSSN